MSTPKKRKLNDQPSSATKQLGPLQSSGATSEEIIRDALDSTEEPLNAKKSFQELVSFLFT